MKITQNQNQHLAWRAGFGPALHETVRIRQLKPGQLFDELKMASANPPANIEVVVNPPDPMTMGTISRNLPEEEKRKLRQQSREGIKNLNLRWLDEMVSSPAQLREKMAFFWHGHFACRSQNGYFQQLLLNEIRKNALGNFGDLLRAVSKSPAMINFLNNNQNRKGHPNENFAREVMELYTIGKGNYSEEDVKEAARSFTGWGANPQGEFVFRKFQHDAGEKNFLGRKGNFTGDDILDILLEQRATARFITAKLYRFFVNDEIDPQRIDQLSARFYQSGYNIISLLTAIYTSEWFYDPSNMGNRIKSPVELWVGMKRQLPMTLENESMQLVLQRLLGQILLYPPNVAGWPGGRNWIDGSSLLLRLRLPAVLQANTGFNIRPKSDDDQQMGRVAAPAGARGFGAKIDWGKYAAAFQGVKRDELLPVLRGFVLQSGTVPDEALLHRYTDQSGREAYISTLTISMMSCPEYQLC